LQGADPAAQPTADGRLEEAIELASSEEKLVEGETSTGFNLFSLRDLWVRVKVARMPRTALLHLTFTSPSGEVFYETKVLFSRGSRATHVKVPGARHAITAFPAKRLFEGFALDQSIPIGLGVFMRYPKPGTWLVQATLEGRHEPLGVRMELSVAP
jgi:hypothetical protein